MEGPNTEILETVLDVAPDLSLIVSGGVGSLDDLAMLADSGFEAAIVGRALYEGQFTLEEAIAVAVRS
jgi:phosphoribosylformimino-5-aminoimidazole carboxamide ribonucleotide (ProFAR) isomerase